MKKRYVLPVLTLLFLFLGFVPVQAETENIKTESVTLTEDNRYNPEYYQKPEVRYPAAKTRTYSVDSSAQTLEEYILTALENFETEIDVYDYKIPAEEASSRYFQIINSHPEFFYVGNRVGISPASSGGNEVVFKYKPTYSDTQENIVQQKKEFEIAADQAAAQVDASMSDLEKALVVHDYLVQNCEYDKERLSSNSVPEISHTAYGALVEKIAVCDGYGKAYAYIMKDKLGIPCELVSSDTMNHAWNLIQIGGEWYHVDATWDDPTWDSIGRVVHSYFLLSDGAISDEAHRHSDWVTTRTASSTLYDSEYWSGVNSAFCYNQGIWYYSQYDKDSYKTSLLKRSELLSGTAENVYTESATWNNYINSYMYLTKTNGAIYFNTPIAIKRLDADGTMTEVYKPTIPSGQVIFGFTVRGEQLCYALQSTPNLTSKQQILTYTLPELSLKEIEGVTAEKVSAVYDGTAKRIVLKGTQAGDIIQYAGEDGIFQDEQPELIDAGTYQVLYKVQRTGYQTLYGDVQVEIEKAVPEYTVPAGLSGWSGNPLASVFMKSGFSWMDSSIKMYREGTHKYLARYMPDDQKNFQTVTDIEVEVTVKCPYANSGHKYTSEITKEPTETENGEKTFTCSVCGDSYVEEIAVDLPEIEGIRAEDIKTVYNGSAQGITVEGTKAGDIVQYAGEDKVYGEAQPEMIYAGVYKVFYKVIRTGCRPFYGTAQVEIEKAVPEYTVPADLKGASGTTLESVELPEGFVWQTDLQTKLYQEGKVVYLANYTPKDLTNYVAVEDIEIEITVKCPGHQYSSEVTKEPTATENGEETYTCQLCGDSYTIEITDPSLPKIEGIYAENISAVFDGTAKTITVEGIQAGDIVQYAGEDKVYGEAQPEMIHAGTYLVLYKVEREGYQIFYGRANVEIEKAAPEYTVPVGLQGASGTTLETVELPEGFVWQTDPQTKLYQEGKVVYLANYIPKDADNYVTVEKIEIEVTVKCPGHQYTSEVTKEPTATQKGEETFTCQICGDTYVKEIEPEIQECQHQYQEVITKNPTETSKGEKTFTCSLCGDSYTEEIPMLEPRKPANVTGLKVKKNTNTSLTFTWKKVNGVNYRLVFYKESKKVSTKYLSGSSYTYKKLKAATGYTLKVTPYRVVNGKKVYAKAEKQVRTATAPAAVKLSAVKKTGRSKVKLTWKKTTGATGYEIFMKTNKAGYKKIKSIAKAKTVSYTKTGLKKGKTYSFRLRAYKTVNGSKIYGAYSNVKKIKLR